MSKPKLIALYSSGPRMGKSTCADHLQAKHGYCRVSFAAPIRHMVDQLCRDAGVSKDDMFQYVYGDRKEEVVPGVGATVRHMLRTLGTDWGRNMVNPDLWLNIAKRSVEANWEVGWPVVVDDARFPNEFDFVKSMGGVTVRLHRPELEGVNAGHQSDGALDGMKFDYYFMDGNLETAINGMDKIVGEWK